MANVNKILFREYIEHFWAKGTWSFSKLSKLAQNFSIMNNIWSMMQNKVNKIESPFSSLLAVVESIL